MDIITAIVITLFSSALSPATAPADQGQNNVHQQHTEVVSTKK